MARRKHKKPCYYCGGQACSVEHVPPKLMFKGFSCDRITVPSCLDHNSHKSGADQAIVSAFLTPLSNYMGQYSLEDDVLKAIDVAQSSFERTKRKVISIPLLKNPSRILKDLPDVAYLDQSISTYAWIRQLTAGLVYDGLQDFDSTINWADAMVCSPNHIPEKQPASLEQTQAISITEKTGEIDWLLRQRNWDNGWSAHPKPYPSVIYAFQLHFESDHEVIFRHRFYGRYTWYVFVSATPKTIAKLKDKVAIQTR